LKLSFIFCMFWFLANYTYNFGLTKTSVSSSTVLSNTAAIFVYIIGMIFLNDKFHIVKGFFVLVSFGGVIIITL
jgi:solute carrier family 35 protein F5